MKATDATRCGKHRVLLVGRQVDGFPVEQGADVRGRVEQGTDAGEGFDLRGRANVVLVPLDIEAERLADQFVRFKRHGQLIPLFGGLGNPLKGE